LNFKNKHILPLIIIVLLVSSCGLKTRPKPPTGSSLPSIADRYSKEFSINKGKSEEQEEEAVKGKNGNTKARRSDTE